MTKIKSKNKVIDIKFSETPQKKRGKFDVRKFEKQAEEVRKTFKDEDLSRLRLNLSSS